MKHPEYPTRGDLLALIGLVMFVNTGVANAQRSISDSSDSLSTSLVGNSAAETAQPPSTLEVGTGTVSLLCDGSLIVRIRSGAPDDPRAHESDETYFLSLDTTDLALVSTGHKWTLQRSNTSSERVVRSGAAVSVLSFEDACPPEPQGCAGRSMLAVEGDLTLILVPSAGYGYFSVSDKDGAREFALKFAIHEEIPFEELGGGRCCIDCPNGSCCRTCWGLLRIAYCQCAADGTPVCTCEWIVRGFDIDVVTPGG